jgi:hypothetical protein
MIPNRISAYLDFIARAGVYRGDHRLGEFEIVTNAAEIIGIEKEVRERYKTIALPLSVKGVFPPWQVGIISATRYFVYLRDAVLFPKAGLGGKVVRGVYDRLIYTNHLLDCPGVCLLPITSDKKMVLTVAFRHSTRMWGAEVPGTISLSGESAEESVARCARNELGEINIDEIVLLGHTVSERGILGARIPIYAVMIDRFDGGSVPSNMVSDHLVVSPEEYLRARMNSPFVFKGKNCLMEDAYSDAAFGLAVGKNILR